MMIYNASVGADLCVCPNLYVCQNISNRTGEHIGSPLRDFDAEIIVSKRNITGRHIGLPLRGMDGNDCVGVNLCVDLNLRDVNIHQNKIRVGLDI
jgi:hypothetical protein